MDGGASRDAVTPPREAPAALAPAGSPPSSRAPASSPPSRTTSRTSRSKSSRRLRWLATATCRYLRPWTVETDGTAMPRSCSSISICLLSVVQRGVVQAGAHVAEADDVQRDRQRQLQLGRGLDQAGEVARLVDVLLDQAPVLVGAVLLERHPRLERVEAARELEPVVGEPGHVHAGQAALALAVRQVRRASARRCGAGPRASRTSTQPTGYVRYIHLCRSKASESARSIPATRCARLRSDGGPGAERAVHVEPEALARRRSRRGRGRSSIAPVLVVPATPTTQTGCRPPRGRAATDLGQARRGRCA